MEPLTPEQLIVLLKHRNEIISLLSMIQDNSEAVAALENLINSLVEGLSSESIVLSEKDEILINFSINPLLDHFKYSQLDAMIVLN